MSTVKPATWPGPPPRMRGRLGLVSLIGGIIGTTPAHAGKTPFPRGQATAPRDHPRACGEDPEHEGTTPQIMGPPPRMRGRHRPHSSRVARAGTTPAHAGKTLADLERCHATGHFRYDCFGGNTWSQAHLNRTVTVALRGLRTVHDWLPYFDLARLPGLLVAPLVGRQGRNGAHDEVLDLS